MLCTCLLCPYLTAQPTSTVTFAAGIVFLAEMTSCALHGVKHECVHPRCCGCTAASVTAPVPGCAQGSGARCHRRVTSPGTGAGALAAPAVRVWDVGDVSFYALA